MIGAVRKFVVNSDRSYVGVETKPCVVCGEASWFMLDYEKFKRWQGDENIQDVFVELTPAERETLISGTHGHCFDELFSPVMPGHGEGEEDASDR